MKKLKLTLIIIGLFFVLINCKKNIEIPVVFDWLSLSHITHTTLIANVKLKELNTSPYRLGVVFSEFPNPTVNDNSASDYFDEPLYFSIGVSGLKPGTTYYMKPFIESHEGYSYGEAVTFQTLQPEWYIDLRDGQKYLIKTYNQTTWMIQNLNYRISGSRYFSNDSTRFAQEFGRLYTYAQASLACPPGWRLPTSTDWENLIWFCGSSHEIAMQAMVEPGNRLWDQLPQYFRTNSHGFTIKPSGAFTTWNEEEIFPFSRSRAVFWTHANNDTLVNTYIYSSNHNIHDKSIFHIDNNYDYFSVRCVKDN